MKKHRIPALLLALVALLVLASCDQISSFIQSRTRPLKLIEIYNSKLVATRKMAPNDTLYVKVQGLLADSTYTIQCLDPDNLTISEIVTQTDEDGAIGLSPLWYDVGFKRDVNDKPYLDTNVELALRAFNIRVFSTDDNGQGTDFKLPFYFVNSTDFQRPEPIVMAGKVATVGGVDTFSVENAFYSDNVLNTGADAAPDKLYVKVANMTDLGSTTATTARVYIVPFNGQNYGDKSPIQNAWFYQDCALADLISTTGVLIRWPKDDLLPHVTFDDYVPQYAEGEGFSVILDVGSDETYNVLKEGTTTYYLDGIDGNGIAGFIVKKPPTPPIADYVPMNLASGGIFGWQYSWNGYYYSYYYKSGYDYRDRFDYRGMDTMYATHVANEFLGYGIKVIWNPYSTPSNWPAGETMPSNFWGSTVNLYIVPSTQSLATGSAITPATGTYMRRVPVQYGCSNGYWQQTVWRSPMVKGDYMMIVDMDKSGTVSNFDLVDDRAVDGTTQRLVNGLPAGFSVY
ncbi:MAG TPA: hypothetical protein VN445_11460 [Rectinemataceae bacterium]|nr:hypothetical protein [Rectinemataceae bacterium]